MKRILCLFFALVTVLSCLCLPTFAASDTTPSLYDTTVAEDFETAGFDYEEFFANLPSSDYNKIVGVSEYYYNETQSALLFVYVYVYDFIDIGTTYADLTIATKFGTDGAPITYSIYTAGYVDCEFYDSNCSFYKFALTIDDVSGITLDNKRHYFIDFMTLTSYDPNGVFEDSYTYTQNDYEFTATSNSQYSTSNIVTTINEVLTINTQPTVYRTVSSDNGQYYQYDIFSVYFAVPNEYVNNFDFRAISYKCYEQLYNGIFTDKDEEYDTIKEMQCVDFSGDFNSSYGEIYVGYDDGTAINPLPPRCMYRINGTTYQGTLVFGSKIDMLLNTYKVDDHDSDDIYIRPSEITSFFDYDENGVKSKWTVASKRFDEKFDINSFSGNDPTLIVDFLAWCYGYSDEYETQLSGVDPIINVDDAFFEGLTVSDPSDEWCSNHLVNKRDVADFKSYYDGLKSDNTIYLFRFAVRDYYASGCEIWCGKLGEYMGDNGDGKYFQGTAFNQFEVIKLTYAKEDTSFELLVKDTPKNINGGGTPPVDTPVDDFKEIVSGVIGGIGDDASNWWDDLLGKIKGFFEPMSNILKTIGIGVVIIFAVVVLIFLSKPIGYILRNTKIAIQKHKQKRKEKSTK